MSSGKILPFWTQKTVLGSLRRPRTPLCIRWRFLPEALFTDVSAERAVTAFVKVGFNVATPGKHIGMSDGVHLIPDHKRLNPYTLEAIIKDAGLTDEEFSRLL